MAMNTSHESTFHPQSPYEKIITKLSSFSRKRPTAEGAKVLAEFAIKCDLSVATTLLSTATHYFG